MSFYETNDQSSNAFSIDQYKDRFNKIKAIYTILFTSYFGKTKISGNQGLSIFTT